LKWMVHRLNVVLCNWSKFYHIGTLPELLHHFCSDTVFASELACSPRTFSVVADEASGSCGPAPQTCVIHSRVGAGSSIGYQSVVE
jgi:hypothetical protein